METVQPNCGEQVFNGPPDRVLSLEEASRYLNVSPAAIRTWKREGKAPAYFRAGKLLRFRKADLDAWIRLRLVCPQSEQQT